MLTLDQLAGDWLTPDNEEHFSLPAISNFHGMVQCAWDVCGVQNWIYAPCGLPTPCALLYVADGNRIRRFSRRVSYRWSAFELSRKCDGVSTATRLPEGRGGLLQRITIERDVKAFLVFTGLPRVWRFTDYWNLPPWDVPQFNLSQIDRGFRLTDCKTFGVAEFAAAGRRSVYTDVSAWLNGDSPVERGNVGVVEIDGRAGSTFEWSGVLGFEEKLTPIADFGAAWESGRRHWNEVWEAAFTPGNRHFSGHLPTYAAAVPVHNDEPDLARLYYMSVLTLLMTRRIIPAPHPRSEIATGGQCIWAEEKKPLERAYVWGGPEGAPTTSFLWEVEFQAPLLARLDPTVLRLQLEAMMRVDLHKHWGIETISGAGAGMGYGVNPGAFLSCVRDYVRITGDKAWALRHIGYLKSCLRPELTDYGDCQNILECVSTYEHTVASFNALAVMGLRFMGELTGDPAYSHQADALAKKVIGLFAGGAWHCVQPDGTTREVKTILDFVYVGRSMTADLPAEVRKAMLAFFERELQTEDWVYALAPSDPDALTPKLPTFQTFRADHQATGSYDGWPARAASVLLRIGDRKKTLAWLSRLQELTREGPFGQARFIHEKGSPEAVNKTFPSRTRKASFFNGNCYFESAGCGFATTILEDLG